MISNFDFNFKNTPTLTLELPFSEHIEELRQRIIHIFWIILLLSLLAFIEVKFLVRILELPINNVNFFNYHLVNILFRLSKSLFIQVYYLQVLS